MKGLIILILALIFISCTPKQEAEQIRPNISDLNLTPQMDFNVNSPLSLEDTIIFKPINYTDEYYIFEFCGVPFAVLEQTGTSWRWIYPYTEECVLPTNKTMRGSISYNLADVKYSRNLTPGDYKFKIFYSTIGPSEKMKEKNKIVSIDLPV